jgi:hypothetical protein
MKKRWSLWIDRGMQRVDGRMAGVGSLVFLGFVLWVLTAAAQAGVEAGLTQSIDTSWGMSANRLLEIAEIYGPAGRQAYIVQRWTFDVIWPIVYGGFFMVSALYLGKKIRLNSLGKGLLWVIPLGLCFDFLENSLVALGFSLYPTRFSVITELAVLMTPIKWVFVGSSMMLVLGLALIALVKPLVNR